MKIARMSLCLALLVALPSPAKEPKPEKAPQLTAEQQAMMQAWEKAGQPGEQHRQLAGMVGEWTTKQTMWMDPQQPPMVQVSRTAT